METEAIFLDENYLREKLNQLNCIKTNRYYYKINKSDRPNSNSIYVKLCKKTHDGFEITGKTLRISDHKSPTKTNNLEFLIKLDKPINKGRKNAFGEMLRALEKRSSDAINEFLIKRSGGNKNG